MKQITNFLLIGLVLFGIVVVYDGFYIVREGKQVMITQFGKPIGTPKTDAGLYFKVPFLQQVNEFDKRIFIWDGDPNQIPTNDKTFVYLDVTARLSGPLTKPELELTSSPAVPRDEIISRVLFNKSAATLSAAEAAQLALAVRELTGKGGGTDILGFARRSLGVDVLRVDTGEGGAPGAH